MHPATKCSRKGALSEDGVVLVFVRYASECGGGMRCDGNWWG